MSRFLFAWELGAGFGHVARIEAAASALAARGHSVALALRELPRAGRLGQRVAGDLYQAPFAPRHPDHTGPVPNYGGMLLRCGYDDADGLGRLLEGWRSLFRAARPDLVVADHSPTALLAARIAGLPACAFGAGHTIPPDAPVTPCVQPWQPAGAAALAAADARALEAANRWLEAARAEPLGRIADLFDPARDRLQTLPELDHYEPRPAERYAGVLPPPAGGGRDETWAGARRPRVFAYLDAGFPATAGLVGQLAASKAGVLLRLSGRGGAPPPEAPGLRLAEGSLDLAWVARHADLAVTHCNFATTAQLLLAGVRVLVQPAQGEQSLLAWRLLQRRLIGAFDRKLSARAGGQAIRNAAVDRDLHEAAQGLRRKYRGVDGPATLAATAGHFEALAAAGS